jgi:hypothetical protein
LWQGRDVLLPRGRGTRRFGHRCDWLGGHPRRRGRRCRQDGGGGRRSGPLWLDCFAGSRLRGHGGRGSRTRLFRGCRIRIWLRRGFHRHWHRNCLARHVTWPVGPEHRKSDRGGRYAGRCQRRQGQAHTRHTASVASARPTLAGHATIQGKKRQNSKLSARFEHRVVPKPHALTLPNARCHIGP